MCAKVFISSTGEDLAKYRKVARKVCEELGLVAIGMETFEAMDAGATEGSLRKLDEADVYVGIIAHRYGYIEDGRDKSVTELEYLHAGERGLERICFLHDPAHRWPPKYFDADAQEALDAFKARIDARHIRARFTTKESFRHQLYRALESWKRRQGTGGEASPNLLHQLPAPPADFTGRMDDLTAMLEAVEGDGVHGVTICGLRGMGGVGKTSLALVAAERLAPRYPDAQLFVDLHGTDPEPLSPEAAMAQVVQAFQPGALPPEDPAMLASAYRSALHGKRVLLLLDNAAGPAHVQPLLPPTGCLCLVTSRRRFALPGQREVDLDALSVEEARELLRKLAARIEEAAADRIAALCGRLPLALRLAGSALSVRPDLTPADYARSLADAKARLGLADDTVSIEGSIELSWNLLDDADGRCLAQLSVFPAGFDRAAAAAVWDLPDAETDGSLGHLFASSLLDWDPVAKRYRLHDLIRDFAAARLDGDEEITAARRHAEHYARVLRWADDLYRSGGEDVLGGLALFDRERRNVEAGFGWARSRALVDQSMAWLCGDYPNAGAFVLHLRLHPRERIAWLEAALAAARSLGDRAAEGWHLGNLGLAYSALGEPRRAIELTEQQLAIAREVGDRKEEGTGLGALGTAYRDLGEPRRAIELYNQHLAIAQEVGHHWGEVSALGHLATAYRILGDPRRAIELTEQQLAIAREIGARRHEGNAMGSLGIAYATLGEPSGAIEHLEHWLAIAREIGDRKGEGAALGNLGNAYAVLGEARRAIESHEQHLAIAREIGDRVGEACALGNLGNAYADLGEPRRAIEFYEQCLTTALEIGDRRGEGNALGNLGLAYADLEEPRRAIEFYEQHLAIAREIGDRWGEARASWNLGLVYEEEGDIARAVDLMSILVEFEREIGHPDAVKHAERVEEIRRRMGGK